MALNLAVREDEKVYVGDRAIRLVESTGLFSAVVQTDDGRLHKVSDSASCEVYPDVFVSVGLKSQKGVTSLAVEAPRNVVVLREELYWKGKESAVQA